MYNADSKHTCFYITEINDLRKTGYNRELILIIFRRKVKSYRRRCAKKIIEKFVKKCIFLNFLTYLNMQVWTMLHKSTYLHYYEEGKF